MYSKIKLLGHPIHPMLVAYPIAFYTTTLVAFIVYALRGDTFWFKVALAANLAGFILAAVAAIPGVLDWLFGIPAATPAKSHGLIHMLLNLGAAVFFVVNNIIYISKFTSAHPPSVAAGIILSAIGMLLTVIAGYYGFMLIQEDHVGTTL